MKISKIYLRVCSLLFVCFLVCGSILRPVVTYASPYDLMINTDSNALMTLELDDSDYLMMSPRSSIGTVTNTLDADSLQVIILTQSLTNGKYITNFVTAHKESGRYYLKFKALDGYKIISVQYYMQKSNLPSPGNYYYSFDLGSQFYYEIGDSALTWVKDFANADDELSTVGINHLTSVSSGDIYIAPFVLQIGNISQLRQYFAFNGSVYDLDVSFAISFVKTNNDASVVVGPSYTVGDYENDVSSSLSDLSSSVDTMTDEISGVTEAIQNLQGAMEPHYSNVLTQLHHITEQLHAFYDQVYNNIHLKEYALWQDIKTAIENIDLEVNVNLDKLKSSIDNMSTAVQNKLQSTTDQITGGYDNAGITQENEKLEQSINQYDEVESGIFEDAEGFIGDFEYPSVDSLPLGIIKALAFVGSFLQGVFLSMGEFSVIITFSLTMIFVMVVVGYHRIRS